MRCLSSQKVGIYVLGESMSHISVAPIIISLNLMALIDTIL